MNLNMKNRHKINSTTLNDKNYEQTMKFQSILKSAMKISSHKNENNNIWKVVSTKTTTPQPPLPLPSEIFTLINNLLTRNYRKKEENQLVVL